MTKTMNDLELVLRRQWQFQFRWESVTI